MARVNVTPVETKKVSPVAASKKIDLSLNYGKAIQLYQNKQYEKAIIAFENLLKRGIKPALADNCTFWMGVCYFNLKRTNQAISTFKDVLSYPGSDKAESAYFMIGQCYEQMGATNLAKLSFEQMLRSYPKGTMKQLAEKKIALLR